MGNNDIQQLLVEVISIGRASISLNRDEWLEGFKSLNSSFETDRPRLAIVFGGGLCHDRANQVISQHMRPNFLSDKFWCSASQVVHLHGRLDGSEIDFIVPPGAIQGLSLIHI